MGRIPSGLNPAHRLKLELSTNKASKHKWKARSAFWKAKYEEMERLHSGQVSGTSVESSFSTTQAELAYLASELAEQAYIAEYERACREAAEERREIATILWQSLFEGVGHALEFDQEGGQDAGLLIEENVQLTNTVGDLQRRIRELEENAAASTSTTPSADERQPSSPTRGGVELKGLKDYRRVLEYGQTSSQPPPVQRMRTTGRRPTSLIAQSLSYMLVRIRSKDGNFRFELQPKDDGSLLAQKIIESTVDADVSTITISNQPRGERVPLSNLKGRTLTNLGVKHGDLIFVNYQTKAPDAPGAPSAEASTSSSSAAANTAGATPKRPWELVQEDAVDTYWRQRDGKIQRSRDPQFCKHSGNGMCDYCMPLEPYDPKYHADHNIKHLSFHAYVRKLAPAKPGAQSSTSSSLPPLDPLSYRVKVPCPSDSHPSYPAGICTKCQPSAITLQRQPFRMVDHLEFSSPALIDGFLQSWRHSGNQRIGWMIGRYMPYEDVPMGIKAVVEAIHEPPQEGEVDGLSLELPWEDEKRIEALAHDAGGLSIVGYIFTDLTPSPDDRTKSICKRHQGSYFLSSLETLFAAQLQNGRPTSTKSSSTGKFASRLVTAVLSGTPEGGIDVQAYMASEQACAMVDADMVEASVDPGIVRVKEEDGDAGRYIPD
ncbi:nuclear protein localization protein 4, partial [Tulasnella sp. 403]